MEIKKQFFFFKYALGSQSQGVNWQKRSQVFCRFSCLSRKISELKGKGHEPSQPELKILQLELRLEPARLGLITTMYIMTATAKMCYRKVMQKGKITYPLL